MGFILGLIVVVVLLKLRSDVSGLRARVEHMERYLEKTTTKQSVAPAAARAEEAHTAMPDVPIAPGAVALDEYGRSRSIVHTPPLQSAATTHEVGQPGVGPHAGAAASATPSAKEQKEHTEFVFSSNILVWVGVVAVLLGVGFFLKYSFENNIIGPTGRVMLGIISGLIFMGIGDFLRVTYARYAQMLSGAGIGLLYLSLYGTLFYNIGSPLGTLFFMGIVTATSLVLSVRYDSRGIAVLGLIGGYCTPLFFGTTAEGLGGFVLLNYLLVLTAGTLVLAYFRNWSWAVWGSFVGTALLMSIWLGSPLYDTTKFGVAFVYLSLFWLLFTLATLVFYYFHDRAPSQWDVVLLALVGIHYAGTVYWLLHDLFGGNEKFFGLIPLTLAFLYAGIAYLGLILRGVERSLTLYPLGMAVLFLTLVFPFEFDGKWLTVSWFAEAAVLGYLGLFIRSKPLAQFAIPVYALGLWFLLMDAPRTGIDTLPIINERFFLYGVGIASAFCLMYAFTKISAYRAAYAAQAGLQPEAADVKDASGSGMFMLANVLIGLLVVGELGIFNDFLTYGERVFTPFLNARFLLLFVVTLYAYGVIFLTLRTKPAGQQFDARTTVAFLAANILVFIAGVSEIIDYERYHDAQLAILNVRTLIFAGLAAYAGGMSYVLYRGVTGLFESARTAAYALFVALNAILVAWGLVEIGEYYNTMVVYVPLFNPRMVVMLLGVAFAGSVAYLFYKRGMRAVATGYFITAHLLLVLLGIAEILDYHYRLVLPDNASRDVRDTVGQQASMYVTGYLVLYGFIALVLGLMRRFALLRNVAIATLLVAIAKVFLFDIWELDAIYRIVALLALGVTLLVVGYLYYKYKDRTELGSVVTPNDHA